MDALEAATTTASAVSTIGSHFMVDGATYAHGASLGFSGLDFYVCGRAGVLGDVPADVVTAALTFFSPDHVRTQWEAGGAVVPPAKAAAAFAACAASWAEAHVPDDLDAGRLADLAGRVVAEARVSGAPIFAGWRLLEVPATPKAAAVHHLNGLRELRFGLHAAAVLSTGLSPLQAMTLRSPQMLPLFGWAEGAEVDGLQGTWDTAEERTNLALAHAFAGLDDAERAELADLAGALHAATKG
jgi:hypothetical protein